MKGRVLVLILIFWFCFLIPAPEGRKLQFTGDDVRALMAFKGSSVDFDPNGYLKNWVSSSSTPCSWWGVFCSGAGEVTGLNLAGAGLIGKLHLSDLMGLSSLTDLHLAGNFLSGDLSPEPSPSCSFQTVDLSANNFSGEINLRLPHCKSLASFNISGNSISGGVLEFGSSPVILDLSENRISDSTLLNSSLLSCPTHLNFSGNKLTGKLTGNLRSCDNLLTLDLSNNHLSGEIPTQFMAQFSNPLKFINLSGNNFTGDIANLEFGTCGNLTVVNLSGNSLTGAAGFSGSLNNCQHLEVLNIGNNALKFKIPGTLLGNLKNLKQLHLNNNQFSGEIPPELGGACATLQVLDLSGNHLSGELPATFSSCSALVTLNLGHNQLSGEFISTVISTIPNLRYFYAPFNNFTGSIPPPLMKMSHLQELDLSANGFTGNVPSGLCSRNSAMEKLLLADNYLTGAVPKELGICKNLRSIDLSFNNIFGPIPIEIWSLPQLSDLVMWANNITGEIPEGICINGGNLQTLILNNNRITGKIPNSITKCTNLIWVSLSSNRLTGEIPLGVGDLQNLAILQLGNNSLTGAIPRGLGRCRSLIWLDLNSNALTGAIPFDLANQSGLVPPGLVSGKQFAFVRNEGGTACRGAGGLVEFEGIRAERLENLPLVHSCPSTRIYSGVTVYTFTSNGTMMYLDFSYNLLSGTIPENLGSMSYLQVLNLGHNNLNGTIPFSLGGLKAVGVLDLSHNELEGFIPGSLGALSFLNDLDVSNNNLSGSIPSSGQLTTFPASRYENNSGLCGVPLPSCGAPSKHELRSSTKNKNSIAVDMVIGIGVSLFCIIVLSLTLYKIKKRQKSDEKRDKYIESLPTSGGGSSSWKFSGVSEPLSINVATFEKPLKKLTFAHLLEATNGFSTESLIGSGGFGEVYKAQLKDGCVVAIKKLIHVTGQGDREFMAEMETIGKIKHRNVVPLLGYCKIGDERLLVYEYMKWGSLEAVLHDRHKALGQAPRRLDWPARRKIAIGSARGLAFLHHSCIPHIIHRDMKSSNVLLDEDFEARVSDFGMARLMNALETHLSVSTLAGTPGYVPPEYYQSFRCTTKGDVYSYGVVLLELLSGHRPIDPEVFGEENNLVGWAKQLQREKRISGILDPEIVTNKSGDGELYQYLKIAFECLDDKPFCRPTMIQVMAKFKEIHMDSETESSESIDDFSVKNTVIVEEQ